MKNLFAAVLASTAWLALAGCADNNGSRMASQSESATMSSDPKDMTSRTTTTTETSPPAQTQTEKSTSTDTDTDHSYPAIHSSGQGAGI